MTPRASVRPAEASDLAGLEALEEACFSEPWSGALLASCLEAPHLLVRVIPDEQLPLAASAVAQCVGPDEAELLRICCHPDRRRRGHAQHLLKELVGELTARSVRRLFLEVRRGNGAALALYRNVFDFEIVGERTRYYPDGTDALVLRRIL
ncbi:MAG: GNAT family N-acetyltransferase [Acidobacteriota bacterium]